MNNYTENDAFEFGNKDDSFNYNLVNGFEQNNYENENLFNTEVYNNEESNVSENNIVNEIKEDESVQSNGPVKSSFEDFSSNPFDGQLSETNAVIKNANPFVVPDSLNLVDAQKEDLSYLQNDINSFSNDALLQTLQDSVDFSNNSSMEKDEEEISNENDETEQVETNKNLETKEEIEDEQVNESAEVQETDVNEQTSKNIQMSNEDLSGLTEFKEEKIETSDIKTLFDRVGINVKEASDIFKRNTEMKEKLDSRFEELKKLQLEVSKNKQEQYDEINSYKDEVLGKLNEKKAEIEKRLNKLKDFQTSLEKEKEEFEQYRRKQKAEIERVQKEVQDAYDSRREELKHVEDVLRRQKDSLDEERSQLSLDKIQYEADKNELANNLLKFNEIVDSFTSGIDKIDKIDKE